MKDEDLPSLLICLSEHHSRSSGSVAGAGTTYLPPFALVMNESGIIEDREQHRSILEGWRLSGAAQALFFLIIVAPEDRRHVEVIRMRYDQGSLVVDIFEPFGCREAASWHMRHPDRIRFIEDAHRQIVSLTGDSKTSVRSNFLGCEGTGKCSGVCGPQSMLNKPVCFFVAAFAARLFVEFPWLGAPQIAELMCQSGAENLARLLIVYASHIYCTCFAKDECI